MGEKEFLREEINGSSVILQFSIPIPGWEGTPVGWITDDGGIFEVADISHESPCRMEASQLEKYIQLSAQTTEGLLAALALHESKIKPEDEYVMPTFQEVYASLVALSDGMMHHLKQPTKFHQKIKGE